MVYLNDAIVMFQSATQKHVTLSVTEAELAALVSCVQDMLYVYRIIISLGLQVELPMTVELDNSGARDGKQLECRGQNSPCRYKTILYTRS